MILVMPEGLLRPQLGEPHHFAYVVDDIEATVGRLVDQLGAGPFFLVRKVPFESTLSRGEPATFLHNSAFGQGGGGPIELIEIIDLAPERVERGFSGQRPALHHVGYAVPAEEVGPLRSELDQRGLPEYLSTQLGEVESTLHDASASLGHDIEVHVDSQALREFFGMVRDGAEGWDGSEPLRPVPS
jgi:Glyoxalase/Bleomycin resistance protein/Dioxygenase superfamily